MPPKRRKSSEELAELKASAQKPDEMTPEVLEFIQAIDDYKRLQNRPFPSWSEVLEILKTLGYERVGRG